MWRNRNQNCDSCVCLHLKSCVWYLKNEWNGVKGYNFIDFSGIIFGYAKFIYFLIGIHITICSQSVYANTPSHRQPLEQSLNSSHFIIEKRLFRVQALFPSLAPSIRKFIYAYTDSTIEKRREHREKENHTTNIQSTLSCYSHSHPTSTLKYL